MPVVTPPKILAWVPLAVCVALAIYMAIEAPAGSSDPSAYVRGSIEAAMHGHISAFLVMLFVAAFVCIGCAVPFILHIAENPAVTRKGPWIIGALFVAAIVLPIYASKRM